MGTRADFYVGKGPDAEWIGSIGWDGYPDGIDYEVLHAKDEESFREAVTKFFSKRDDVTLPESGWPWPWEDSGTTDYSYWQFDGMTWGTSFGRDLFSADKEEPEEKTGIKCFVMPNMTDHQKVATDNRSGLIFVTV